MRSPPSLPKISFAPRPSGRRPELSVSAPYCRAVAGMVKLCEGLQLAHEFQAADRNRWRPVLRRLEYA
jgi:hypothetical protein